MKDLVLWVSWRSTSAPRDKGCLEIVNRGETRDPLVNSRFFASLNVKLARKTRGVRLANVRYMHCERKTCFLKKVFWRQRKEKLFCSRQRHTDLLIRLFDDQYKYLKGLAFPIQNLFNKGELMAILLGHYSNLSRTVAWFGICSKLSLRQSRINRVMLGKIFLNMLTTSKSGAQNLQYFLILVAA